MCPLCTDLHQNVMGSFSTRVPFFHQGPWKFSQGCFFLRYPSKQTHRGKSITSVVEVIYFIATKTQQMSHQTKSKFKSFNPTHLKVMSKEHWVCTASGYIAGASRENNPNRTANTGN